MTVITILLAESAIETIPLELIHTIETRRYLQKVGKRPEEIILDTSYHSNLMQKLPDASKRGRPDIVHFALLAAYGSILGKEQRINVIVHTRNDEVITIDPSIRLPRNIDRFKGLLVQLFKHKQVPPESDKPLMRMRLSSLEHLLIEFKKDHDLIIEFSVTGEHLNPEQYCKIINSALKPLLIFGAFPHGRIEKLPENLIDKKIAIFEKGLDLFAVISHILANLHMYEQKQQHR
ncbi:MAG: hypothetical protein ACTSYD_03525 [Candidatus Heimdallarchaeaceae archaeon]